MGAFDYNTADGQRDLDVIPNGTIAVVQLNIRPGDAGEDGMLRRSKDGGCEMLDCEFVVVEGPHAKRKFFSNAVLSGTTDGHAQAADITRSRLRAILESARGIKPTDVSEAAKKARIAEYRDFDGIRFLAKIGIEPAKGEYKAKNTITTVITPDMKEWRPIGQVEQPPAHTTPATTPASKIINKPAWAQRAQ
jgi:hypothetical protein